MKVLLLASLIFGSILTYSIYSNRVQAARSNNLMQDVDLLKREVALQKSFVSMGEKSRDEYNRTLSELSRIDDRPYAAKNEAWRVRLAEAQVRNETLLRETATLKEEIRNRDLRIDQLLSNKGLFWK